MRQFAQLIFCQDKPILGEPGAEAPAAESRARKFPVRADAASAAYRQWLRDTGIRVRRDSGG
jgi:hypothetical protein